MNRMGPLGLERITAEGKYVMPGIARKDPTLTDGTTRAGARRFEGHQSNRMK